MTTLTEAEIAEALKELPKWGMLDGKLTRDCEFGTFADAMAFVQRVAEIAERQNHHPDIDIRSTKVRLGLVSHDAGGITRRDLRLAARVDEERA
jgi:4a-hydroxytetrahydrobiopterin dehydratase